MIKIFFRTWIHCQTLFQLFFIIFIYFKNKRIINIFFIIAKSIITTFVRILPASISLLTTLLALMYIFASLGVQLFGGLIYHGNLKLSGSAFHQANYYANNFNDMASGMVLLFELLVVNNWHILMDGFVIVTNWNTHFFFIAFYVVGVLVMLNVVVAFILEAFHMQWAKLAITDNPSDDFTMTIRVRKPKKQNKSNLETRKFEDDQRTYYGGFSERSVLFLCCFKCPKNGVKKYQ